MNRLHLILSLFLLGPATAGSAVWIVSPDGTADFVRIQDAIEAAADGDEIRVRPGTYLEILHTRGKAIDLIGEEGAGRTIVDADELGSGLTIPFTPAGIPSVTGMTFTNGIGTFLRDELRDGRFGGGAWVELAAPRFEGCRFVGNRADYGGGVYAISGAPLFIECEFTANAAGSGGGFAAENDAGVRLVGCRITGNQSVFGGGIDLFRSRMRVESTIIAGNTAYEGGAVRVVLADDGPVRIVGSRLTGNGSECGGAICARDADLEIEGVTIADNDSGPGGAAVDLDNSMTTLAATIVSTRFNRATIACEGGATSLDCVVLYSPWGQDDYCGQGDRVLFADPLFCGADVGDYTLHSDSPCLPGQGPPGCGLIGALGQGCDDPVAVESVRLGTIKQLFR